LRDIKVVLEIDSPPNTEKNEQLEITFRDVSGRKFVENFRTENSKSKVSEKLRQMEAAKRFTEREIDEFAR
jgi:hypothetical protein